MYIIEAKHKGGGSGHLGLVVDGVFMDCRKIQEDVRRGSGNKAFKAIYLAKRVTTR